MRWVSAMPEYAGAYSASFGERALEELQCPPEGVRRPLVPVEPPQQVVLVGLRVHGDGLSQHRLLLRSEDHLDLAGDRARHLGLQLSTSGRSRS